MVPEHTTVTPEHTTVVPAKLSDTPCTQQPASGLADTIIGNAISCEFPCPVTASTCGSSPCSSTMSPLGSCTLCNLSYWKHRHIRASHDIDLTRSGGLVTMFNAADPEKSLQLTEMPDRNNPHNRILLWGEPEHLNGAELSFAAALGVTHAVSLEQFVDSCTGQYP